MSDPQDELGARFDDRRPDADESGDTNDSGSPNNSDNSSASGDSYNTGNAGNVNNKPGPDPDENATRHRRQIPMYLPDEKADSLNALYEQLDGRSKVAGNGGIEKHADFMEVLVEFVVEHEDELAARLGIDQE